MDIKITTTQDELKKLGLTSEELQNVVLNRVDSLSKNGKKLFWDLELSCQTEVKNSKAKLKP